MKQFDVLGSDGGQISTGTGDVTSPGTLPPNGTSQSGGTAGQPVDPCSAIVNFQKAGVNALVVSSDHPEELVSAIRVFLTSLKAMLAALGPEARSQVQPAASPVLAVAEGTDSTDPDVLIAKWNNMLTESSQNWTGALDALMRVCPKEITAGTTNQAEIFRLGGKLQPGFSQ